MLEFIQIIKADCRIAHFDEAATKQVVILKLLSFLGWDVFGVNLEVCPEYPLNSGERIDYSLKVNNINHVFIEVKKTREYLERLTKHTETYPRKLLRCAVKYGIKMAVLTNGIIWHFYLPSQSKEEENKFCSLDILQPNSQDVVTDFIRFLSKENVASGRSIQDAELSLKVSCEDVTSVFSTQNQATITNIQRIVSQHLGVGIQDMKSKKRTKSPVIARQIGMYLARTLTNLSLEEIGMAFGGKDHTTIMYAVRQIEQRLLKDKIFKKDLDLLKGKLGIKSVIRN